MMPQLRPLDLMEVEQCSLESLKPGDVIAFRVAEKEDVIVHRTVSVKGSCILTRGDNRGELDPWRVSRGQIVGRVVGAWRRNRRHRIYGGLRGRISAALGRVRMRCYYGSRPYLKRVYQRYLRFRPFITRNLPAGLRPHLIMFKDGEIPYARLMLNKRVIGTYDYHLNCWHVPDLFRLLVDVRELPVFRRPGNKDLTPISNFKS